MLSTSLKITIVAKSSQHDSGGFILAYKDFERMFDHLFPACTSFLFLSGD